MFLQSKLLSDDPLISPQTRYRTFPVAPIGNRMEVCRVCIPLQEPFLPAPLPPIFLLHLSQVSKQVFQAIPDIRYSLLAGLGEGAVAVDGNGRVLCVRGCMFGALPRRRSRRP